MDQGFEAQTWDTLELVNSEEYFRLLKLGLSLQCSAVTWSICCMGTVLDLELLCNYKISYNHLSVGGLN